MSAHVHDILNIFCCFRCDVTDEGKMIPNGRQKKEKLFNLTAIFFSLSLSSSFKSKFVTFKISENCRGGFGNKTAVKKRCQNEKINVLGLSLVTKLFQPLMHKSVK